MGKSVLHAVVRTSGKSSERKRLLKLCVRKLQCIEDPETYLCRSVLINNTLRNLQSIQREARLRREREAVRRMETLEEGEEVKGVQYTAEDILEDIVMPLPLSPTLEDLAPLQESSLTCPQPDLTLPCPTTLVQTDNTSHIHTNPGSYLHSPLTSGLPNDNTSLIPPTPTSMSSPASTSPLMSSNSSLSSGWLDRETLDWVEIEEASWANYTGDESILWERSKEDVTATLDLTLIQDREEEEGSESSECSGEEAGSEGEMYDREVTCSHSYIAQQSGGMNVISSLILES